MKISILLTVALSVIASATPTPNPAPGIEIAESHKPSKPKGGEKEKRDLVPFQPSGPFNSGNFYYYGRYFTECDGSNGETWFFGRTIKTTIDVRLTSDGRYSGKSTAWWTNSSSYDQRGGPNPGGCNLFSKGLISQCTDGKVTKTRTNVKGKGTVKTYFDCLLQKTVQSWYHSVFKATVVNWQLAGWENYRFYDDNNFAWFVSCPLDDYDKKKRATGGRVLPTKNPIWDFGTPRSRNPYADATPLSDFDLTVRSKNFKNPDLVAVGATYWVPNTIEIDGRECQQMAVSRPGLLHWTATFYYGDPTY
ncbi:hypothetical protein ABW19_dt0201941 [Dactylella cylindrospora]|nr:hypothetical protein ABW19_dt0201941 [Dactylella cylindrospora]